MNKFTTTALLTIAACAASAAPALAQSSYNGGSTYRNQQTKDTSAIKKAKKLEKKRIEAMKKKEKMEKELMMKEQSMKKDAMGADTMMKTEEMKAEKVKSYGSGTKPMDAMDKMDTMKKTKTYGSDTKPMNKMDSYGSGAAPTTMMKPTNCPAGTEPQNNGTCMLTSGSLPGT